MPEVVVKAAKENAQPMPLNESKLGADERLSLRSATSDTAGLLGGLPGVSLQGAGGVSSLPSIRGLADDRLRIKVDGMDLISACANHMNPPLSYIDPTGVGSVEVMAGVTPVSVGGDSIGGTILASSPEPKFAGAGKETLLSGEVGAFYRSNGNGYGGNLSATIATEKFSMTYRGSTAQAEDYRAGDAFKPAGPASVDKPSHILDGDEVGSTMYKSINQSLDFALRHENHQVELMLGWQDIPYQGFPNQRMDMTGNDSRQANLRYKGQYDWGTLEARAYHERTRHKMDFYDDKQYWYGMGMMLNVAGMPMETEGENTGALVKAAIVFSDRDVLRIGGEAQRYRLNDWWDPVANSMMMSPNTFWNINDGERDRLALFAEWEARWNPRWMSLLGVRGERVDMDTGRVQGYNTGGGMMGYGDPDNPASVPGAFNAANRSRTDNNLDWSALIRYTPDAEKTFEAGLSRKTRSPNLYERYSWSTNNHMVMNMNNWFGDGNGYAGNLDLEPEVAHTLSVTANWHDASKKQWGLSIAPFYTLVDNYIDAVPCASVHSVCPGPRADGFLVLSLDNQDARLYGLDVSGFMPLGRMEGVGSFTANGVVSYVKGWNTETDDALYNVMPLNARFSLVHKLGGWSNTMEIELVKAKSDTSQVRKEMETDGYGLLNLRSSYAWKQARFDIGIENVLDTFYNHPLGGAYLGQGGTMMSNAMAPKWGTPVPGMGRSIYAGVNVKF